MKEIHHFTSLRLPDSNQVRNDRLPTYRQNVIPNEVRNLSFRNAIHIGMPGGALR